MNPMLTRPGFKFLPSRKINMDHNEKRTRKSFRDTNVQVRILAGVAARTKQLLNDDVLVGRRTSPHFLCRIVFFPYDEEHLPKGFAMWNNICEWFACRYIPADSQTELADALFNWKYGK